MVHTLLFLCHDIIKVNVCVLPYLPKWYISDEFLEVSGGSHGCKWDFELFKSTCLTYKCQFVLFALGNPRISIHATNFHLGAFFGINKSHHNFHFQGQWLLVFYFHMIQLSIIKACLGFAFFLPGKQY